MVHVKLSIAFVLAVAAIAPVVAQPIRRCWGLRHDTTAHHRLTRTFPHNPGASTKNYHSGRLHPSKRRVHSSAVPSLPSADSSLTPPGDSTSLATPLTREYVEGLEIRVVPAANTGDTPPPAVAPVDGVGVHAGPTGIVPPRSSSTVSAVPHLPHPGSPHKKNRPRGHTVSSGMGVVDDTAPAHPPPSSKSSFVPLGGREFIDVQDKLERSLEDMEFEAREFEDFDLDARDFEDEVYLD